MKILIIALLLLASFVARAEETVHLDMDSMKPMTNVAPAKADRMLVYFWATWCPDCQEKLKGDLAKFQNVSRLSLATFNLDQDRGRVEHFLQKENLQVPVFRDEDKRLRKMFGAYSVPHWALLEKQSGGEWKVIANEDGSDMTKAKDLINGGGKL